jgi:hypothetical protein
VAGTTPTPPPPERVGFGTRVTLEGDAGTRVVAIAGADEADPAEGRISSFSSAPAGPRATWPSWRPAAARCPRPSDGYGSGGGPPPPSSAAISGTSVASFQPSQPFFHTWCFAPGAAITAATTSSSVF